MDTLEFARDVVEVRVVDSEIGRVIPIVDIARAIDYDYNSLKGMIERSKELFDGMVVSVTLTTYAEQRSRNGGTHTMEKEAEVKALNHYGVFGILMKLDYNRIQDEHKKQQIIRFQRWAMRMLADTYKELRRADSIFNVKYDYLPDRTEAVMASDLVSKHEALDIIEKSSRTLYRLVRGKKIRKAGDKYSRSDCEYVSGVSYSKYNTIQHVLNEVTE